MMSLHSYCQCQHVRKEHYIEILSTPLTCASVSCGLLVVPDLWLSVISNCNEEPQDALHYGNAETPTATATNRPVVPCLA